MIGKEPLCWYEEEEYWHIKENGELATTHQRIDVDGEHDFVVVNCPDKWVAKECWKHYWAAKIESSLES